MSRNDKFPSPYEIFKNKDGFVRIWKSPSGVPKWIETRTNNENSYIKLTERINT